MDCPQLLDMRRQATQLFQELNERRRRTREYTAQLVGRAPLFIRPSDYEGFLRRRLVRTSERIDAHITRHRCQA